MSRYGLSAVATDSCVESTANMKKRLKLEKRKLEDFIEVTNHMDMNWEARQQAVGSMCLNIRGMKKDLATAKYLAKQRKAKKSKK